MPDLLQASRELVALYDRWNETDWDDEAEFARLEVPLWVALRAAIAAHEAHEAARERVVRDAQKLVTMLTFRVQDDDTWVNRAGELNRQANVLGATLSQLAALTEEGT